MPMPSRICASIVSLCACAALAQAPTTPANDPLLDKLAGHWVIRGTVLGKQTTHDLVAEWVLGHQYLRLHEVAHEKNAQGQPAYEAIVFVAVDRASEGYTCLWLDSTTGDGLSIEGLGRAKREADALAFVFRDKQGQVSFTNTFAYDKAADVWTMKLDNVADGKPKEFARFELGRM